MGNFFLIRWLGPWKHRLFVIGFLVDGYFCFGCSGYCSGGVFWGSGGIGCTGCSRWVCCSAIMRGRWRGPITVSGWGPITLIWWGRGIGIMNFYRFHVFYSFWRDVAVVEFWMAVII